MAPRETSPPGIAPWRLGAGLALILGVWLMCAAAMAALLGDTAPGGAVVRGPARTALTLIAVAGLLPGLWLALRLFHPGDAALRGLLAVPRRPACTMLGYGLALGLAAYALSLLTGLALAGPPERVPLPIRTWAQWLVPLAALIAVQATAEELVFRGYLLTGLRRRFAHPAAWAGLPSLLFGALHYDPSLPGHEGALLVLATALFGLAAAVLVWRTGGLGAAIGLHAGVNLGALLIAGQGGARGGALLWRWPDDMPYRLLAADLAAVAALLAIALLWPLRRRPASI